MDTPVLQAAASAYKISLGSLAVIVILGLTMLTFGRWPAMAAALGGLVAWLPHMYVIGKFFGVSRRGVKPVTMAGLLGAELSKLFLTAALFALAFAWVPKEHAGYLFAGFIPTMIANLVGLALLTRKLDKQQSLQEPNHGKGSGTADLR